MLSAMALALALWALAAPSFAASLSTEKWDLAPLDGMFDQAGGAVGSDAAVEEALADIRRETGPLPPIEFQIPRAPRLPIGAMPEPEIEGLPAQLMWSLAARSKNESGLSSLTDVAQRIHDGRPSDGFTMASMPDQQLGEFDHDTGAPQILLSERLKRLKAKGVPSEDLASVLAHELDHGDAYYSGDHSKEADIELRAFQREARYLRVLGKDRIHKKLEDAAAKGDPEVTLLYADMALILEADEQGVLPYYIKRAYKHLH
jgi:hypothetical protein